MHQYMIIIITVYLLYIELKLANHLSPEQKDAFVHHRKLNLRILNLIFAQTIEFKEEVLVVVNILVPGHFILWNCFFFAAENTDFDKWVKGVLIC